MGCVLMYAISGLIGAAIVLQRRRRGTDEVTDFGRSEAARGRDEVTLDVDADEDRVRGGIVMSCTKRMESNSCLHFRIRPPAVRIGRCHSLY